MVGRVARGRDDLEPGDRRSLPAGSAAIAGRGAPRPPANALIIAAALLAVADVAAEHRGAERGDTGGVVEVAVGEQDAGDPA